MDNVPERGRLDHQKVAHSLQDEVCKGLGKSIGTPIVYKLTSMLLKTIGFCLAKTPDNFLSAIAMAGGHALVTVPNPRRRILLSNLKQAFPEWSEKRILRVARQSAAGMVEMGLFSLAYPCMSDRRMRRILSFSPEAKRKMRELRRSGEPVVVFIPHVALFEALPASPLFGPGGTKKLGGVYRPHRNPALLARRPSDCCPRNAR